MGFNFRNKIAKDVAQEATTLLLEDQKKREAKYQEELNKRLKIWEEEVKKAVHKIVKGELGKIIEEKIKEAYETKKEIQKTED